jgi:hypothetical protein
VHLADSSGQIGSFIGQLHAEDALAGVPAGQGVVTPGDGVRLEQVALAIALGEGLNVTKDKVQGS